MQLISCHNGRLLTSALPEQNRSRKNAFRLGLPAVDELLPPAGFARGAIHEILSQPKHGIARFFALLLARSAATNSTDIEPRRREDAKEEPEGILNRDFRFEIPNPNSSRLFFAPSRLRGSSSCGAIVWSDPRHELYPPAVAMLGIPLDRLYLLHPQSSADQTWAIAECLRCRGVAATIADVEKLTRIEARRLQLAAEQGKGVGILLRPFDRSASIYAAATRWLVAPAPGERTVQRWKIQLIHGHGGRIGQSVILEHYRETSTLHAHLAHSVHSASELADRPPATRASA